MIRALLTAVFCFCLLTPAGAVQLGEAWTTYQTFTALNVDPVVSTSFGICSTSAACPLTVITGPLSSGALWTDTKAKLYDPQAWITLSYTWGTSPNTLTHVQSHFQVLQLLTEYGLSQPGESWNTYKFVSSFQGYAFDSMDFPLSYNKQVVPVYAATPYDYSVTHGGLRIFGHVGAPVPEPASWVLCLGVVVGVVGRRR